MPRHAVHSPVLGSDADRDAPRLLLALRAGDGALGLARDLAHDFFALFLGDVLDQRLVGLLELGIDVDPPMRLCASDPLCAEHHPYRDGTTLHGAACHACMFLPTVTPASA